MILGEPRFVRRAFVVSICLLSVFSAANVAAQALAIAPPFVGDCSVTVTLPPGTDSDAVRVTINGREVTRQVLQRSPYVELLKDPLQLNAEVGATAGTSSAQPVRVAAAPPGHANTTCAPAPNAPAPVVIDERSTFEASGYLGAVFDNFAPSAVGNYKNNAEGDTQNRLTAGVDAQYRILGSAATVRQLWISAQTLHGLRSADVDCGKTPEAPVCKKNNVEAQFLYILEHASTMEAQIDTRFEFLTLQVKSDTPVRAYVSSRFGFVAMDTAPRVFNSNTYAAIGILSPKGAFRGSFAQVGWGRSEQFQSQPGANRLKIFGTLAFDLAPSISQNPSGFVGRLLGGSRVFVAIVVDRNPGGTAPDAVQSYVGYNFDLRKAFGSF